MSVVQNHLLFHKAILGVDGDKIDNYLEMASAAESATKVAVVEDSFTKGIAILFHLVTENELDPWALDLPTVIKEYQNHALKTDVDLPMAGAMISWAWDVLKIKSSEAIVATEAVEIEDEWEPFEFGWEPTFIEKLENSTDSPIEEVVRYSGKRRVTLMELVGALEEAREVATEREKRGERLKGLREKRARALEEASKNMGENIHNDNPVLYKEKVWNKINEFENRSVPLADIVGKRDKIKLVKIFVGSLFLAHERRIKIKQKDLKVPEIYVESLGDIR